MQMIFNPWMSASVRMALEGKSFIDSTSINIESHQEAKAFLECYGFDLDIEEERTELESIRKEAICLIEQELLVQSEAIPDSLREERDICNLLLFASGKINRRDSAWAGAILRVMHTLAHSHSHLNDIYHNVIREQIIGRFESVIERKSDRLYIGDVELILFEQRKAKSRFSVALKLMHKAENVAADIFDWIGIRLVTKQRADAVELLAYLRLKQVIAFSNIKPSRTRNSLIDLKWLDEYTNSTNCSNKLKDAIQFSNYPMRDATTTENQFSESAYHSIQLTCRQRIRITQEDGKRLSFFFPFELQIMDNTSYLSTKEGIASHSEYKRRQRESIRYRVLPFLAKKKKDLD